MILVPGPVELHERVLKAIAMQVVSHRSEKFSNLLTSILEDLKWSVGGNGEEKALLLTGSGTLGVEAMIYSLVNPGDRVLVLEFGEFGRRMRESLESRGARLETLKSPPGSAPSFAEVAEAAERFKPKYIATVHVETSTGAIISYLERLSRLSEEMGAQLLLDAVSSLGGEELRMSSWNIFAVASCSQKGLGGPPGLSIVALSSEASRIACRTSSKPSYLDLCKYLKFLEKRETPFTPAINLMYGLAEALRILREEGKEERWSRIQRASSLLYNEAGRLGYSPLPSEEVRAHTVAALVPPRGRSSIEIAENLKKRGIYVATGMGDLKEKILRVGVMGYITEEHVRKLIGEMERIEEEQA
ncbi:MAG: alanine--glyoxylate aminotransferase family protein [Fervidicoccaceae archaeon]